MIFLGGEAGQQWFPDEVARELGYGGEAKSLSVTVPPDPRIDALTAKVDDVSKTIKDAIAANAPAPAASGNPLDALFSLFGSLSSPAAPTAAGAATVASPAGFPWGWVILAGLAFFILRR